MVEDGEGTCMLPFFFLEREREISSISTSMCCSLMAKEPMSTSKSTPLQKNLAFRENNGQLAEYTDYC